MRGAFAYPLQRAARVTTTTARRRPPQSPIVAIVAKSVPSSASASSCSSSSPCLRPSPLFSALPSSSSPITMGGILSKLRGGAEGDRCTVSASIRRHYGISAMDPKDAIAARGGADEDDHDPLWLVVGLGNPGPRYDGTRHNIGFAAVDFLAQQEGITIDKVQCNAAVGKGRIGGGGRGGGGGGGVSSRVLLAKPLTFMNVSGESVGKLARFYRVPAARVLVLYDDLDTSVGVTRLRSKGGHGGHNGVRSVMSHLGNTKDFPRVRLGVSRPPGNVPVVAWVLQPFKKEEQEGVELSIREACDAVRAVLSVGLEKAVSGVRV